MFILYLKVLINQFLEGAEEEEEDDEPDQSINTEAIQHCNF